MDLSQTPIKPPPNGESSDFAHPQDALHSVNLATQILSIAIVTPFVILRLAIKMRIHKSISFEDCW